MFNSFLSPYRILTVYCLFVLQTVFDSITLVTAVDIATDDLPSGCTGCTQEEAISFPSTLVLQWSPNRKDFYDQPFQVNAQSTREIKIKEMMWGWEWGGGGRGQGGWGY